MKRVLMAILAAVACGCSTDSTAIHFTSETPITQAASERIIVRAKYHQTSGPCVDLGNGTQGIMLMDEFVEVETLEGTPKIRTFDVDPMSHKGERYPAQLIEGQVYKLVITPGESTRQKLVEPAGGLPLMIKGAELELADAPAETAPASAPAATQN